MISTSDQYKLNIYTETVQKWHAKGTIKFSDGSTYPLQDSDFWDSGVKVEDGTSRPNVLAVGEAAVNKLTVTLQNFDGRFDNYDFTYAEIQISTGMKLPDGTIEWLNKGTFTVDEPVTASEIMIISLADDMTKFDRKYDSPLSYPNSLGNILDDACTRCGVLLETQTFINSDYVVSARPADDATTYRDIVSYVAQLAGCWARINNLRKLVLDWYDLDRFYPQSGKIISGGTFKDYTPTKIISGGAFKDFHPTKILSGGVFRKNLPTPPTLSFLNNPVISTEDVKITGVQITPNDDTKQTYFSGSTGYVVNIQKNPLAQDNIDILAESIGNKLIGFRFRPMNVSALDDPSIEAGDVAYVNGIKTIISNLTYSMGNFETFSADAETKAERNEIKFSPSAKAVQAAKQETVRQISEYDLQTQSFTNMAALAMGLFTTEETLLDGSKIKYWHDKPTLVASQAIWKMNANVFVVSNDGGQTYHGMSADGNILAAVLTAIGVNAQWVKIGGSGVNPMLSVLGSDDSLLIKMDKDGITMANGAKLIGGNGVLSTFVYQTSGQHYGFEYLGWESGGWPNKTNVYLYIYVPEGITITKATAYVDIISKHFINQGVTSIPTGYYTASNIKLYTNLSLGSASWYCPESSETTLDVNIGSQNTNFGTWNPTASETVQRKSADITTSVASGQRALITLAGGADNYSDGKEYTDNALAKITVVIEGYKGG